MAQKVIREIKLSGTEHRINEFFAKLHNQFPYSVTHPLKVQGFYQGFFAFEHTVDITHLDNFLLGTHLELQVTSTPSAMV